MNEEEEEEEELMFGSNIHLRYGNPRMLSRHIGEPPLETFIVPIQNKENKDKNSEVQ